VGFVGNLPQKISVALGWLSSRWWLRDLSVRYSLGD
jgi:hypothetical protein